MSDPVNHPSHYTSHPEALSEVECMYGTENEDGTRRQDRPTDDHRTRSGEEQHSVALPVRVRERDARVPAEPELGTRSELRMQTSGGCCREAHGEDDDERVCLRERADPPAGASEKRAGAGTHPSNGGDAGPPPSARRGSTPQERGQGGQQAGESGTLEQEPASRGKGQRSSGLGAGDTEALPTRKSDPVNHPLHYTSSPASCSRCGASIECIQITEHMGFNLGNAFKYVWRADLKADALEDLRKAIWYIDREIQKRERQLRHV